MNHGIKFGVTALMMLSTGGATVAAQDNPRNYPNKAVRFVVPFPPAAAPIRWRASSASTCRNPWNKAW